MAQNSTLDFKIQRGRLDFALRARRVQSRRIKREFSSATEYNKVGELRIVRKGVSNACIPLHAKT
jgi:hypothetical protein